MLRWSALRMGLGARSFANTGQWGDGREAALADYVVSNARKGDLDDVLSTIDTFAYEKSFLINIGDEKGHLLDTAIRRISPKLCLELDTYVGYSALRIARAAPSAKVFSVEFSAANAELARRVWAHAGVEDRVCCISGTIGDGGRTLDTLANNGFGTGTLDFLFLDHHNSAYLADLLSIIERGWLHPGSIVVADNVLVPGAPKYRKYMREQQGKRFNTIEHRTHLEYQDLVPDLVLESEYLD
jgi:catechol O-methyltransferase